MNISDLNFLEAVDQATDIVGSGGVNSRSDLRKRVNINKNVRVNINKDVFSRARVRGNLAEAEALADAAGRNSLAETFTFSQTSNRLSEAASESTSATN